MHSMATASAAAEQAAFNKDLFAAVSAIIPVLFLAIVVESRSYRSLLKAAVDLQLWARATGGVVKVLVSYPVSLLLALALLIVVSGTAGECVAVYALYQGQASQTTEILVTVSTWFLVGVVAAGPLLALIQSLFPDWAARLWNRDEVPPHVHGEVPPHVHVPGDVPPHVH
jgi:hypothetical protein